MKSKLFMACPLFAFVSRSWGVSLIRRSNEQDIVTSHIALQTMWESNELVEFKEEMSPKLQGIPLNVAAAKSTNRGAVTVLPGRSSGLPQDHIKWYSFVVKWNQIMLGPKWGLQIFYGDDSDKYSLEKELGNATNIVWSPMIMDGKRLSSKSNHEYAFFRLTPGFWEPLKFEHVLIFEGDSLVVKPDCVDQFLEYDYVGAAWGSHELPGNGGFTLRTRSTGLQAAQSPLMASELPALVAPDIYFGEDRVMGKVLKNMGAKIAEWDVAQRFAIESIDYESPCGFHKPWWYLSLDSFRRLLKLARQEFFSHIAKK